MIKATPDRIYINKFYKGTSKATLKASHLWTYQMYNSKHKEKQLTMSVAVHIVTFETCHKNLTYVLYTIYPSSNKHVSDGLNDLAMNS